VKGEKGQKKGEEEEGVVAERERGWEGKKGEGTPLSITFCVLEWLCSQFYMVIKKQTVLLFQNYRRSLFATLQ